MRKAARYQRAASQNRKGKTVSEIDISAPNARGQRDALAARTDVLNKVKVLSTLADNIHVTTDMVANFYEVGVEAVRSIVKDHRDEVEEDGYRVVTRDAFEKSFGDLSNLDPRARQIALFPRRAVLRIGMLLRDSPVAKKVRDYLLNAEVLTPLDMRAVAESFTPADLARMILRVEEEKSVIAAALESATPAIEYHDRHIAEDDDIMTIEAWGHWYGMTEPQAFSLLREKKVIYRHSIGRRWSASKGRVVDEYEYRAYAPYIEWFVPRPQHNAPRHHNNQVRMTLYVKVFFGDRLGAKLGLIRVDAPKDAA